MIDSKPIEVFCGTGGVGKTTLATSRALHLASHGKKVLLITIDPAKRLKQVLKIDEGNEGVVVPINSSVFNLEKDFNFYALLMSPQATMQRLANRSQAEGELDNKIIRILTKPYGGMNEIMAIIELQHQMEHFDYETIILDTPPGKHFIDFLQSSQKISQFFDQSFVDLFKYFGKSLSSAPQESKRSGFLSLLVKSGIKKLLSYLENVTGPHFVEEFIEAISGLYRNREAFTKALTFQRKLQEQEYSHWFLTTSVDQFKKQEASELRSEALEYFHGDSFLLVNRSLMPYLEEWKGSDQNPALNQMKHSMEKREEVIRSFSQDDFKEILYFPEIFSPTPEDHVAILQQTWTTK